MNFNDGVDNHICATVASNNTCGAKKCVYAKGHDVILNKPNSMKKKYSDNSHTFIATGTACTKERAGKDRLVVR